MADVTWPVLVRSVVEHRSSESAVSLSETRGNHANRPPPPFRRAFSLVELIVAVTIMAILAALVVPRVSQWIGFTKSKTARADAETISNQVRMYMTAKGLSVLPDDFSLVELTEGDTALLNKNQLTDPWGNQYQIKTRGEVNLDFDVYSFGADGQSGGEGESADIIAGDKRN
jgi:general secretion pathway protein G